MKVERGKEQQRAKVDGHRSFEAGAKRKHDQGLSLGWMQVEGLSPQGWTGAPMQLK